jgi:hypothetical protein
MLMGKDPPRLLPVTEHYHPVIHRTDARAWHQGPVFNYRASPTSIDVNVVGSSWPIRGLATAEAVLQVLASFKKRPGQTILDFGAGSWLRYTQHLRSALPSKDVYAVEYEEAFHDDAGAVKQQLEQHITLWRPIDFVREKKQHFDLILLINVLNTIPEESHRASIFDALSDRLNPTGWLLMYQRIWAKSENPKGAIEYGDGWLTPQKRHSHYTFRASTGARWFNEQAKKADLKPVSTAELSSSNTLLRVWEKPF